MPCGDHYLTQDSRIFRGLSYVKIRIFTLGEPTWAPNSRIYDVGGLYGKVHKLCGYANLCSIFGTGMGSFRSQFLRRARPDPRLWCAWLSVIAAILIDFPRSFWAAQGWIRICYVRMCVCTINVMSVIAAILSNFPHSFWPQPPQKRCAGEGSMNPCCASDAVYKQKQMEMKIMKKMGSNLRPPALQRRQRRPAIDHFLFS